MDLFTGEDTRHIPSLHRPLLSQHRVVFVFAIMATVSPLVALSISATEQLCSSSPLNT